MRVFLAAVTVASTAVSALAQGSMFTVETVSTVTYGSTVVREERNTHMFAPSGFRRIDHEINGEQTTEIVIPGTATSEGEQIFINHTLGAARRGALNMMPGEATLALEPSMTRRRIVRPGTLEYQGAAAARARGGLTRVQYEGQEGFGPLILHHYRAEMPDGVSIDEWRYRFEDGTELPLATTMRGLAPDGTPVVQETEITSAVRTSFDTALFTSAIPAGMRVQDLWERRGELGRSR